jgi:integrase
VLEMPRKAAGLTARQVQAAKTPGYFADGNGLYLQVTATGAKTWIFRYAIGGRRRDMGLGSASLFSLAEAREKAIEAKRLVVAGLDPIEAKRARAAAAAVETAKVVTFEECAEAYIASMRAGWRNEKHAGQWTATLKTYAYPTLGALPVAAIDTGLVEKVLRPIWTTKTETASRVRGRIESILDYARVCGHRSGENPARLRGHLSHILPAKSTVSKVQHHASLPYADMPKFWPRLQMQDGLGARALELAILTATRTGEVLGACWPEIDLDAALWTVPADRMKAGAEHRVPLSPPAVALLRKLATIRQNDLVFAGQGGERPLSNMSMAMCLRRMKIAGTPHGFRSTFRTWAAEKTTFPHEVAEAALAHTIESKVVAAYQRTDFLAKRRELMTAWANYCQGAAVSK